MSDVTLSQTPGPSPWDQSIQATQIHQVLPASPEISQDGDDVLLSADVYWRALPVMDQVLYALQVTGLILNVINIITLTRRSMRSPTSTFLVAVSVLQLLYIIIGLIPAIHRIFEPLVFTDAFYLINSIYIINYVLTCLRRSMYCLQWFVSVERLLAVWLPLKARQFLLVRRPWLFILATPVIVFLAHIHVAFRLEVFEIANPRNETVHSYQHTEYYRRHPQLFDIVGIFMKVIFVYLTLLMLAATNLAMTRVLRRSASIRKQMKTSMDTDAAQKRETQMALTILVSTLIFIVLCLPTVSNSLVYNAAPRSYSPFSPQHGYLFSFVQKFGSLCFVLAFSTDFCTYVALSSSYRNTLLRMFRIRQRQEGVYSTNVAHPPAGHLGARIRAKKVMDKIGWM